LRPGAGTLPARLLAVDVEICRRAARAQDRPFGARFFRVVSKLGDGSFWCALAFVLPLGWGETGLTVVARMAAVGVVSTLVAKALKTWTARTRPFLDHPGIPAGVAPLDAGSFPSGHTLHAVAFSVVIVADLPALAILLVPFTLSVAASRLALGLHYPSDVAAGAAVGAGIASAALRWF
jgi:undecaprenyl-diphosphatase